jgi:hypothetical protein
MKFLIQFITILIGAFILEHVLPWYCIAIAAFTGGYVLRSNTNFIAGFLAICFLWLIQALISDASSSSALADRVALIFPLGQKYLLYLTTVVMGGLVGGFAAMAGASLKSLTVR